MTDVTATFTYDASGQRTKSVVTTPAGTTTTSYVYEGLQLFRVVAADPNKTTTLTYLYDELGRPSLIAGQVSTSPGQTYFLRVGTTERGDVVNLTDCNDNAGGGVLAGWSYDIYGNVTTSTPVVGTTSVPTAVAQAIVAAQPLRYAGYAYDSFSGLYYVSQRYYDPATFQFISADPVGADGEGSEYQYCGGDPVNHTDPTGLMMDFFDTGQASSTGAAHEALIHARAKALRAKLRAKMLAAARRERAQKAREAAAHAAARAKARRERDAAKRAAEIAAMQMATDLSAAQAQNYAAEAQVWQVAADAARNVGYVCAIMSVVITAGADYQAATEYNAALADEMNAAQASPAPEPIDWAANAPRSKAPQFSSPGSVRTGISPGGHAWEAHYDDFGRRIARTDWGDAVGGKPDPHFHLYDPITQQELRGHVPGAYSPSGD